jgi:serine/threonine protein kinase
VKIADFGLSKEFTNSSLSTHTGSPNYVAPEILRGGRYNHLCDMWSIGVITYTLLCGYLPFYNKNQRQLFLDIMAGKFYFPEEEWSTISDEAKDFVRKLLTINPASRMEAHEAIRHPWLEKFAPVRKMKKVEAHTIKKQKIDVQVKGEFETPKMMAYSLLSVGDTVWAGGHNGVIRVYDARTMQMLHEKKIDANQEEDTEIRVYSMLLVHNQVWIGCEHNELSITIWDPKRLKIIKSIQQWGMVKSLVYVERLDEVWSLVPSAQSTSVVVYDAQVRLFDCLIDWLIRSFVR